MSFIKYLHPLWKSMLDKINDSHSAVVLSIEDAFTEAEKDAMSLVKDANLETATGEWLDEYGDIFGVFRKDNEKDDDYRRRIINWILTERATIGSIKDAIEKWLDDPDADVEIYEPFKNVFFLNRKQSTLNGPDHLLGRYYTSAVIDIRFTKHVPVEIIDEIRKFKAAGVTAKLTRLPNRKREDYSIQESKVLRDRNFAIGSDIRIEMWRPTGTGTIPSFNEKTSVIKPRNAFDAKAATSTVIPLLNAVSTSKEFIYTRTAIEGGANTDQMSIAPDAARLISKRKFRIFFNLVKNITEALPSNAPNGTGYYAGVEVRITYKGWTNAPNDPNRVWINVGDRSGVGVFPKKEGLQYSEQTFSREYELDPTKEVEEIIAYTGFRGGKGTVEFRGVYLGAFTEIATDIDSPEIPTQTAGPLPNPIQQPLGGVPRRGVIGGRNVIDNSTNMVYDTKGIVNEPLTIGKFIFGDSTVVEFNRVTTYFEYKFEPTDSTIANNGKLIVQTTNPWFGLTSNDIVTTAGQKSVSGVVRVSRFFPQQLVRALGVAFRADNLKGKLTITNFTLVIGDYSGANKYNYYIASDLAKYDKSDGQYVISDSYTENGPVEGIVYTPAQVLQFDIFKLFEDRYGSNFFANKTTIPEKISYIKDKIRTVRLTTKIAPTSNAGNRVYYTIRKWNSSKTEWDLKDEKLVIGNTSELQDVAVLTTEDISDFICSDGYTYISITGVPVTSSGSTTRLAVDSFIPAVEFKKGTTVFTSTEPTIKPVPSSTDWEPIPSIEYDKLLVNDDQYITTEASKKDIGSKWGPAQIMVSFYLPDIVEKGIGSHIFRGVDDEEGKIQIARNLLSDIGYTFVARGEHARDGNGYEASVFNYSSNSWFPANTFPPTTAPLEFTSVSSMFTVPLNAKNSYVSPEGYINVYIRSRLREGFMGNVKLDLRYAEMRVALSQPDPSTIPSGSIRNILLWSKDWGKEYGAAEPLKGVNIWHNNKCIVTDRKYNGGTVAYTPADWGSMRFKTETLANRDAVKVGDKVILSLDVRIPELSSTDSRPAEFYWTNAPNNGTLVGKVTKDWSRVAIETTMNKGMMLKDTACRFEVSNLPAGANFEFANYMLIKKPETGDINRPYEQAPEEYLFSPVVGNQSKFYNVSPDLANYLGEPITIAVDVEIVNGIVSVLGDNRNRLGTEINYQLPDNSFEYKGAWHRVQNGDNKKERVYTTQQLTPQIYHNLSAGIYLQAFGDFVSVSRPSIYLGADNKAAWRTAPEDRGESTNIYDIALLMNSLVANKDRTYYTIVDNDIIGYKRIEKMIPVTPVNPAAPKKLPKLTFANKEWYIVPLDKVREEGAEYMYYSANLKGGMLDNKGYRGVYVTEFGNVKPVGGFQDIMLPEQLSMYNPANRIAEYLPSYTKNKVVNSNADKYFPYGDSEVFTLENMPRQSRVTKISYTQSDGFSVIKCLEPKDSFLQLGAYNEVWKDIKGGDDVTISVDMRTDDKDVSVYLRMFFWVNGYYEKNSPLYNITKDWTRYTFTTQANANATGSMGRIRFADNPLNLNKSVQIRNIMINKGEDIPYIEGNNKQERIDELDIIHESMIKITKE